MNWGLKIILSFIVFAAGIGLLVYVSFSKNIDLVSENYYEQEIKYQQRIDLLKNSENFNKDVNMSLNDDHLRIHIPPSYQKTISSLTINFYRSDNAKKDFTVQPEINDAGIYDIPTSDLHKGNWKVRIELKDTLNNSSAYFCEKSIFVP